MAQYQSFPGREGASRSLEKLTALRLPDLAGRSFLDVGCNEGFFCGYARFQGAVRSVGIDNTRLFLERARAQFPDCEFHLQGWDILPPGQFDVILLASALHYAEDQTALLHRLVSALSPDGVLVLELGIVSSPKQEWVSIERGIDERLFPTMPMLQESLRDYAWKWMGPSVPQDGDPVPRHVVHVSRRRPVAYLMLEPPGYGKSTLAKGLFGRANVPVVSGDDVILQVAKQKRVAPESLRDILKSDFSPFRIDQTIRDAFEAGQGPALVQLWYESATGKDFALDVYVPPEYHAQVESLLVEAGYMPVSLRWERAGAKLPTANEIAERAQAYFLALGEGRAVGSVTGTPVDRPQGFVDELNTSADQLIVRGWAFTATGTAPRFLEIKIDNVVTRLQAFERQSRPDVQAIFGLPHALYGFTTRIPLPVSAGGIKALLDSVEVRAGDAQGQLGPPLPYSGY